jgi:hypothetical protein
MQRGSLLIPVFKRSRYPSRVKEEIQGSGLMVYEKDGGVRRLFLS